MLFSALCHIMLLCQDGTRKSFLSSPSAFSVCKGTDTVLLCRCTCTAMGKALCSPSAALDYLYPRWTDRYIIDY